MAGAAEAHPHAQRCWAAAVFRNRLFTGLQSSNAQQGLRIRGFPRWSCQASNTLHLRPLRVVSDCKGAAALFVTQAAPALPWHAAACAPRRPHRVAGCAVGLLDAR
eukprot:56164-Chlamydomonas_euryale.AAC.5